MDINSGCERKLAIWALGLPGVVISLAMRKTAGFDFRRVHHRGKRGLVSILR